MAVSASINIKIKPLDERSTLNQPLCHVRQQDSQNTTKMVHQTQRASLDSWIAASVGRSYRCSWQLRT